MICDLNSSEIGKRKNLSIYLSFLALPGVILNYFVVNLDSVRH